MRKVDTTKLKLAKNIKLDSEEQALWDNLTSGKSKSIFDQAMGTYYSEISKSQKTGINNE